MHFIWYSFLYHITTFQLEREAIHQKTKSLFTLLKFTHAKEKGKKKKKTFVWACSEPPLPPSSSHFFSFTSSPFSIHKTLPSVTPHPFAPHHSALFFLFMFFVCLFFFVFCRLVQRGIEVWKKRGGETGKKKKSRSVPFPRSILPSPFVCFTSSS